MALGAPNQSAASAWQRGEAFGVQPAGPVAKIGARPSGRGAAGGRRERIGGLLPGADALDYAHKLTSTTILVVGAIAFVLIYGRRPRRALRALVRKHVGDV